MYLVQLNMYAMPAWMYACVHVYLSVGLQIRTRIYPYVYERRCDMTRLSVI